jgi:hypothetical protein
LLAELDGDGNRSPNRLIRRPAALIFENLRITRLWGNFISRLPAATPTATPTASDNTIVTVLLTAVLPARPGEAIDKHPFAFADFAVRRHCRRRKTEDGRQIAPQPRDFRQPVRYASADTHRFQHRVIRFASIILLSGHYYATPAPPTPSMERIEA